MVLRFIILLYLPLSVALAQVCTQLEPFGLEGKTIHDLRSLASYLYAAADTDGVYLRNITSPDSGWRSIGFVGKRIYAIYPHLLGSGYSSELVLTAGVVPKPEEGDTTRLYCSSDHGQTWFPSDTDIPFTELHAVLSIDGFPSDVVCGETFIGGYGGVFRSGSGGWEKVLQHEIVRLVYVGPSLTIWAAGSTARGDNFAKRSTTGGDSWESVEPWGRYGDEPVLSLVENDSGVVYAGGAENVVRSNDSGKTWYDPVIGDTAVPWAGWFSLAVSHKPYVLAAGRLWGSGSLVMLESETGGTYWRVIQCDTIAGIMSIAKDPRTSSVFYLGTIGDGVLKFTSTIVSVKEGQSLPTQVLLSQNYPNPFNPSTTIRYELPTRSHLILKIFNLVGQEVAMLVDEERQAGRYEVRWDASGFATGVYFYRLQASTTSRHVGTPSQVLGTPSRRAGEVVEMKKLILLR